ncbi:hypothetical protein AG1IA_03022 [Rhizoctonia solani AG-1 IA]|uniref:DUF6699 domain-containing protein n=1 Tax=Thanatephorus cucumeris (strain AG1-IA) TaxID=983506 RepID=L8X1Q9_THACA|nr:hypothetical protein AG1IA_03022 [Rhizoctonia solani AG-1 IA]
MNLNTSTSTLQASRMPPTHLSHTYWSPATMHSHGLRLFMLAKALIHTQVDANMAQLLPTDEDRARLYRAYHDRVKRTRAHDNRGLLAIDWLGEKTLFVCLERDEAVARKRVKEEHMWPYVFSLKLKMRKGALVSDA